MLDMVGGPYAQQNLRCLAPGGRLVLIAMSAGSKAESLDLMTVMDPAADHHRLHHAATHGGAEGGRSRRLCRRMSVRCWRTGAAPPVIHSVFPLSEVAAAHRLMESGEHIGKIVLTV
ncbi:MAG: zinc-binding dehydrogenase [Acetobacteraceae bacterium]